MIGCSFRDYLNDLSPHIEDEKAIDEFVYHMQATCQNRGTLFAVGNGGSYASAQHFVQDINKSTVYRAVHVGDNPSFITAVGNDADFEDVFVEDYKKKMTELPEVHLIISTSGRSENLIRYARRVRSNEKARIFSLTGHKDCPLFFMSDYTIVTSSETIYRIESLHSVLLHYFIERLKA